MSMLDTIQNLFAVVVSIACSLGFMAVVNHYWPAEKRRVHNDLIGWQLSVLGTTYAVIVGFMLYTVWTSYGAADLNADAEANAVVNIYRLADGLTPEQAPKVRKMARAYADAVVDQEWKEMGEGGIPVQTREIGKQLWRALMASENATPVQITAEDHALYELSALSGYRRIRLLQSQSRLPGVLWFVLLLGGVVTIASTCMFGAANGALHTLQVGAFAFLIALSLAAIADINRPYQGSVHVSDFAFRRAQMEMNGD
jgi:hypothetical protein